MAIAHVPAKRRNFECRIRITDGGEVKRQPKPEKDVRQNGQQTARSLARLLRSTLVVIVTNDDEGERERQRGKRSWKGVESVFASRAKSFQM